jgi:DNA-binding LacI/PurR family transcriptional regulator
MPAKLRVFVRLFVRLFAAEDRSMPSVREIADYAGVSTSTVSLALNGKPGISDSMRRHVLDAVRELRQLEASRSGQSLSRGAKLNDGGNGTDVSSVVVFHPGILRSSQVFREFLQGIQAAAVEFRIQLNLAVNETGLSRSHVSRLYLTDEVLRPDGILVIGARLNDPLVDEAQKIGLPVVLVGRSSPNPHLSAVGRDEKGITMEAMEYLLGLGHRAIGFVGGDPNYSYTLARIDGYRQALEEAGVSVPERWIVLGEGDTAAATLLQTSPEITAILCVNDAHAAQALPVLQAAGRRIPEDLSVISYDDTDIAQTFEPPLTSISYPRFQEGFWALKMLVEQVRQPMLVSGQIVFRSTLIHRASCTVPKTDAQ